MLAREALLPRRLGRAALFAIASLSHARQATRRTRLLAR
jgi:hypothetical protein